MSTAINMFVKTVVREKRIPFELSLEIPNAATKQAIEDVENGNSEIIPYTNSKDVIQAILARDGED